MIAIQLLIKLIYFARKIRLFQFGPILFRRFHRFGQRNLWRGEIDIVCMDLALLAQHAKLGTLRLVAAAGVKRPSLAPDLRTAAEQGVPALALEPWYGLVAPAGISAEVRQKLASALNRAVRTAELRQRFEQQGYETIVDTPDTFSALMRSEAEKYARLIETAGIPREP